MQKNLDFLAKHFKSKPSEIEDKFTLINNSKKVLVSAVDGGSSVIMDGGCWILAKLRVGLTSYDNKKLIESKDDYYFTIIKNDEGYNTMIDPDFKLKGDWTGIRDLTESPSLVMKTLEFNKAAWLINQKPGLVLMDSLLTGENKDQEEELKLLEEHSIKAGVDVIGFSKTCRLSINGQSLIGSLLRKKPKGMWYYKLNNNSYVVKLHDRAKHCYLINLFNHSIKNLEAIMSALAFYANDAEILGYPYPLLKVDKVARINEFEKKKEQAKLRLLLNKKGLNLEEDERSTDMHNYLDKRFWRQ